MKTKSKQNDLQRFINRTKSLISLGHIKTVGQALNSLGYTPAINESKFGDYNLEDTITIKILIDIVEIIKSFEVFEEAKKEQQYIIEQPSPRVEYNPYRLLPEWTKKEEQEAKFEELDFLIEPTRQQIEAKRRAKLFKFQTIAARELAHKILIEKKRGILLRAGVGTGKTFILAEKLLWLVELRYCLGKTFSPWPILYVTKASVVEQTKRVLRESFNFDCINDVVVINFDALRASIGEKFLEEVKIVEDGDYRVKWKWREPFNPLIIVWDECQALKNTDSQQSEIAQAFNDLKNPHTIQIFSSATPFTRVAEAKCFVVSTRVPYTFGFAKNAPMTNEHWPSFASEIASPSKPEEHNEAAVKRLMERIKDFVVDVKNVRPQFHARNQIKTINFQTEQERRAYELAWERYLEERAKIEAAELTNSRFLILVQFLKFRQAAELIRAPYLAKKMHESVMRNGKAAVCACNFKATIAKIVLILHKEYGVNRKLISLIWGGDANLVAEAEKVKKVYTKQEIHNILAAAMRGEEVNQKVITSITKQLQRESDEISDIPTGLDLGVQSRKQRQEEIDRFQRGDSLYCLFTFKSGGVGLSLHHSDDLTNHYDETVEGFPTWIKEIDEWNKKHPNNKIKKGKARRKESGYCFESDIKYIPTRPRVCFLAPTYSAIELVQGLGRCPRLTSLSDTEQIIVFYEGTIEVRVAAIVSKKLSCLREVVRQRESWEDAIMCSKDKVKQVSEEEKKQIEDIQSTDEEAFYSDETDSEEEEE